jgi:hypothetical protein
MSTTLDRWTVTILVALVALVVLFGAGLALRAAVTDDATRPPAPSQIDTGGGGRIMFT